MNRSLAWLAGIIVCLLFGLMLTTALAHDNWISRGGFKNGAGEWCCGEYDCKTYQQTSTTSTGWFVEGEFVPYDEALPTPPPDGVLTICRRPDGSRRCVFGPKPSY